MVEGNPGILKPATLHSNQIVNIPQMQTMSGRQSEENAFYLIMNF